MLNVTNVDEISRSLQHFGWPDYFVFSLMLLSCMIIGVYFGYQDHQKHKKSKHLRRDSEAQEYLVGGRNMKIFPVAMSLVASWISGISLLGTSTEIYVYGTQYCYIFIAIIIMGIVMYYIYIPIFHELQITSTYEYLQRRFDKRMRLFGSIMFTLGTMLWLPIVIYVPALAFSSVTGINIHVITPIVCLICVFYTSVGGIKAVVWTDVIQTIIMTATLLLITIKGTYDVGGLSKVLERNSASGRFESLSFDLSPYERHTFWTLAIGGSTFWINTNCINQAFLQRYLSLPAKKAARKALLIYIVGITFILGLCCYNGLLIYATYYNCDPLTTKLIKQKDELVPLFVMDILGNFQGIPGIFVAGVFSAALSSLSTGLNSLSAIVLEDFVKPFADKPLSDRSTNYVMRGSVFIFGFMAVAMVIVVEKLGTVLQLSMSLGSITIGPLLGLFTMGVFIPWVNATGALTGGISAMVAIAYICFRAQTSIALGEMNFPTKPTSIEGCTYDYATNTNSSGPTVNWEETGRPLHHMSYLYYTTVGTVVSCIIGTLVSFAIGPQNPYEIDSNLLAPMLRKYFAKDTNNKAADEMVTHEFELKDNRVSSEE